MKLSPYSHQHAEHSLPVSPGKPLPAASVAQVSAADSSDLERRRSLRQELQQVDPRLLSPSKGHDFIEQDTHLLAHELASLGTQQAHKMLKSTVLQHCYQARQLDDNA